MSGFGASSKIKLANSPSVDAFARLRTSYPESIFESSLQYNENPLVWDTYTEGNGSTLHIGDESALEMIVGANAGDLVIRQSFQYHRYQPGKSQMILATGNMGDPKNNVRKRIGYFDGYDGLFFQQDGYINSVVLRDRNGGIVDTVIPQSQWNLDKLDGTGASKIVLDLSSAQIFAIDFEWLGVGRIRFGFNLGGDLIYCHEILNANIIDTTYMSTANLPIRYEIENVNNTTSQTVMKQLCSTVVSEGGFDNDKGFDFSISTGISGATISTRASVLTIRPKNIINGQKNRSNIIPLSFEIYTESNPVFYEVVYKGAVTSANWTNVNNNSLTEYSTTVNTVTGGVVISSGFVPTASGNKGSLSAGIINQKISLNSNILGTAADQLSIVCTSFSNSATVRASINFKERY
jgi:hypothetical protein